MAGQTRRGTEGIAETPPKKKMQRCAAASIPKRPGLKDGNQVFLRKAGEKMSLRTREGHLRKQQMRRKIYIMHAQGAGEEKAVQKRPPFQAVTGDRISSV